MDISSIASFYSSQQLLQTRQLAPTDAVQKAFANSAARLDKARESTGVQISAYGQVKSGLVRIEDSGKSLAAAKPASTAADIRKDLQALVSTYNATRNAAAGTEAGAARNVADDLRRSVGNDSSRADLRVLGISRQRDGALSLDSKALDTALQSDLAGTRSAAGRIGGQLEQSASQSLSSKGGINSALTALNARNQSIEARQTQQQNLSNASQQAVQQQSERLSSSLSGINSYQRIFSL